MEECNTREIVNLLKKISRQLDDLRIGQDNLSIGVDALYQNLTDEKDKFTNKEFFG